MSKQKRNNAEVILDILKGAADLVGRSPTPLADAAESLGVGFDSKVFLEARRQRDTVTKQPAHRNAFLEAARRLEAQRR